MSEPSSHIFSFNTDVSDIGIPTQLNNPFAVDIPEIARIAAEEFQKYISIAFPEWNQHLQKCKGKMLGVLVIKLNDGTKCFLGAISGNIPSDIPNHRLVPSIFDDSVEDFHINKGMTEITNICDQINQTDNIDDKEVLIEKRRIKSLQLQFWLFSQYKIQNLHKEVQDVNKIFKNSSQGNPPSASGECAAPKLLQYAMKNNWQPIAIGEFWWGTPPKGAEKQHGEFYPACKNKCRPILEFMLDDYELYDQAMAVYHKN